MKKRHKSLAKTYLPIVLCILSFFLTSNAYAAYLNNVPQTIVQPDGKKISCVASGDEFYNWLHDEEGFVIIKDPDTGYYVYAQKVDGKLVPSKYVVGVANPEVEGLEKNIKPDLQKQQIQSIAQALGAPSTGTINNIVIYIRFSGESEFTKLRSSVETLFNTTTGSSLLSYFKEASYNQLTINSTFYPQTSGQTIISYQDSHPRSYYQPYDATTNPTGYSGDASTRETALLTNAIAYVCDQIPADLNIDSDNDGFVDNMCFIASGDTTAWGSILWPHKSSLSSLTPVYINNKKVGNYNFQVERALDVGALAHEMFHTLGAPDLYHYNNDLYPPVGGWDLMGMTINPPQYMGAYMKYQYGKWLTSLPLITKSGTYTLNPLTSSANNAYKILSPSSTKEYFVIEYRKKQGTFESSLSGQGLLIYRINTAVQGWGNRNYPMPDEVYIYRPGAGTTYEDNIFDANLSLEEERTSFDKITLSDGSAGGLKITQVGSAGNTITFNAVIGADTEPPTAPTTLTAKTLSGTKVSLSWAPSSDIDQVTGYEIEKSLDGTGEWIRIGTCNTNNYVVANLNPATMYYFRVRAKDPTNNLSAYSEVASSKTFDADNEPPCNPTALTAKTVSATQIDLNWTVSTDDVAIECYFIERSTDGVSGWTQVGTSLTNRFSDKNLQELTRYYYRVKAKDISDNVSDYTNVADANTGRLDTIDHAGLTYTGYWAHKMYGMRTNTIGNTATYNFNGIAVSWYGANGIDYGMANVYIDNVLIGKYDQYFKEYTHDNKTFEVTGLSPGNHTLKIEVVNDKNQLSIGNNIDIEYLEVSKIPDVTPPSAPTNLTAVAASDSQVELTWSASTDNLWVFGYFIERSTDGVTGWTQVGSTTETNFTDTSLTASTKYYYRVRAKDNSNNLSDYSNIANTTTSQPPIVSKIEDTSMTYTGSWVVSNSTSFSGSITYTLNLGDSATYTFNGTEVRWYGVKKNNRGIAKVYIDNVYQADIDAYAPTVAFQQLLFKKAGLAAGNHTLKIEVVGKNASAVANIIDVDYLEVVSNTPDTQAPASPSGLTAAAATETQIDLSWTASTDNVAVANYVVERSLDGTTGWTQIGTSASTGYSDKSLTAATTYYYRIKAKDTANNTSDYSNIANATTLASDTEPPTVPTILNGEAISDTQINLNWTASTDNKGVTGYTIERSADGDIWISIGTSTVTNYIDSRLTALTKYYYRVKAKDAANNVSEVSNIINVTTFALPAVNKIEDTSLTYTGSWVVSNSTSFSGSITYTLNLGDSAIYTFDGTEVRWYGVKKNNRGIAKVYIDNVYQADIDAYAPTVAFQQLLFEKAGLAAGNHTLKIEVVGKNASAVANIIDVDYLEVVSNTPDTQAPASPSGLTAAAATETQIDLSWTASTDNVAVANYVVERSLDGTTGWTQIGTSASTDYSDKSLAAATTYYYRIKTKDTANNTSDYSNIANATTLASDTEPPTVPTSLNVAVISGTQINLNWTASTDNIGVTSYVIERSGDGITNWSEIGTSNTTSYSNTGLTAGTTYYYRVKAIDAANNASAFSSVANATTGEAPSAVKVENEQLSYIGTWLTSGLNTSFSGTITYVATAGNTASYTFDGTEVKWYGTKHTNRGIAKVYLDDEYQGEYDMYAPSIAYRQLIYQKEGLTSGSHTIRIEVTGTKNDNSSNTVIDVDYLEVSNTPPDTQAPTEPNNLTANTASETQIDLTWAESTDNIGVVNYVIERSADGSTAWAEIGTSATNRYSNIGLTAGTTYYYRVKSIDAANNASAFSNVANATTGEAPSAIKVENEQLSYTGTWLTSGVNTLFSGTITYVATAGNTASYTFDGTEITWYGTKHTNRGIAKVYIDDEYQGEYDMYAPSIAYRQLIYQKEGLTSGSHTIRIEVTGTKNDNSSNTVIDVDYLEILN